MTGLNGWNSIGEIFSYLPLQVIYSKSLDLRRTSDTDGTHSIRDCLHRASFPLDFSM